MPNPERSDGARELESGGRAERTLCIGLGSPHGDDQVGWRIVERLAGKFAEPSARTSSVRSAATLVLAASAVEILDRLADCERLVVVDASQGLGEPGQVVRLAWPSRRISHVRGSGTHDVSLADSLALAGTLRMLPRDVSIWCVEGERFDPTPSMSERVAAAIPGAAERIRESILTSASAHACMSNH